MHVQVQVEQIDKVDQEEHPHPEAEHHFFARLDLVPEGLLHLGVREKQRQRRHGDPATVRAGGTGILPARGALGASPPAHLRQVRRGRTKERLE